MISTALFNKNASRGVACDGEASRRLATASMAKLEWHPYLSLVTWVVGNGTAAAICIENMLPGAAYYSVRIIAYISFTGSVAVQLAFIGLFIVSCACMLWWLDEPMQPSCIAATVSKAYWAITAYVLILIGALVLSPPGPVDNVHVELAGDSLARLAGISFVNRIRPLATTAFIVACVLLLGRHVRPVSAVLAVAFGASAVMLAVVATVRLLGVLPHPL